MKTLALLAFALFGAFFWKRDAAPAPEWPEGVPVFAEGRPDFACAPTSGGTTASFVSAQNPDAVLEAARRAYAAAGWREEPVRAADTLIFTTTEKVSAILVQPRPQGGTRITLVTRPSATGSLPRSADGRTR